MQTKQIVISSPTGATGQVAYTGVGFQGKLLLLHAVNRIQGGSGDGQHAGQMFGAATSSTNRGVATGVSNDAAATSAADARRSDTVAVLMESAAGTVILQADFVSWGADGFTLDWTVLDTDVHTIIATVIGGTDVSAVVGVSAAGAATGNQSVTGLAFQPNTLIFFDSRLSNAAIPGRGAYWRPQYGFVDSAGGQFAWGGASDDALATMNTEQIMSSTACIIGTATAAGATDRRAQFVSYDAAGFTINWTVLDATVGVNSKYMYVALSVPASKVGTTAQRTTTGTTVITGAGFRPMMMMFGITAQTATGGGNTNRLAVGLAVGTASGDQAVTSHGDTDNVPDSIASSAITTGKAIRQIQEAGATPTTLAQASVSAISNDGFTLNWDTVDATARLVGYLAIGAADQTVTVTALLSDAITASAPSGIDQSVTPALLGAAWANPAPSRLDQEVTPALLGAAWAAPAPRIDQEVDITALLGSTWAAPAPTVDVSGVDQTVTVTAVLGAAMTAPAPQVNLEVDISAVLGTPWANPAPQVNLEVSITALLGSAWTVLPPVMNQGIVIQIGAVLGSGMLNPAPTIIVPGTPYEAGNLMMLGVSGRMWATSLPYILGTIAVEVQMPFELERDPLYVDARMPFSLSGRMGVSVELPFTLAGPLGAELDMRFHLLGPEDNVFDEGGLAAPVMGFWDPETEA